MSLSLFHGCDNGLVRASTERSKHLLTAEHAAKLHRPPPAGRPRFGPYLGGVTQLLFPGLGPRPCLGRPLPASPTTQPPWQTAFLSPGERGAQLSRRALCRSWRSLLGHLRPTGLHSALRSFWGGTRPRRGRAQGKLFAPKTPASRGALSCRVHTQLCTLRPNFTLSNVTKTA